jgi:hypothetical protein
MFNALLVELGYFESITVGFLIIGHTHASIDQYFSCLRALIRKAVSIASPIALQHLFSLETSQFDSTYHKKKKRKPYRPPLRQIQLHFVHDYVSFFAPYWNKEIKGYGVPYQFRFKSLLGKAVCQYKQFADTPEWLPAEPPLIHNQTLEQLYDKNVVIIKDNLSLASVAGTTSFMQHVGLESNGNTSTLMADVVSNNHEFLAKANRLNNALPILKELSLKGLYEQEMRREDEENGLDDTKRYVADKELIASSIVGAQATLQMNNTNEAGQLLIILMFGPIINLCINGVNNVYIITIGYIIWLDFIANSSATHDATPAIATVTPIPINPKDIWQTFLKSSDGENLVKSALKAAEVNAQLQESEHETTVECDTYNSSDDDTED